jgi:hypothetical protein
MPDPELDAETQQAFDIAYENIKAFHQAQQSEPLEVETMPGVRCRRLTRPINAVGLYVPGGTAVLPSSALMLAVPAALAGCETIVLATPPRPDGSITPEVLYCAKKAGVTHVLRAGGAQAVAAMAWGTQSCPKVGRCRVHVGGHASASNHCARGTRKWWRGWSTGRVTSWCTKREGSAWSSRVGHAVWAVCEAGGWEEACLAAAPSASTFGVLGDMVGRDGMSVCSHFWVLKPANVGWAGQNLGSEPGWP